MGFTLSAQPRDLNLVWELDHAGLQLRWCLCKLPCEEMVFCGESKYGLGFFVAVAIISGHGWDKTG